MLKNLQLLAICVLFVILIINSISVNGIDFNVSYTDLLSCKEYRIDSGYVYRDFFLIDDLHNERIIQNEVLRLKFYVLTTKDAHILLSESDYPKKSDRVYEIVIGAGGNTFSTIRPQIGKGRLTIKSKSEVLSPIDPVPIEICQYTDGRVDVIIPGLLDPYMTFVDDTPLHIKYLSFSTFGSTPAKWYYDCRMDDNNADHIIEENKIITPRQKLINDLYTNYSFYTPPQGLKMIQFSFQLNGIAYNSKTSTLTTRMKLKMKWNDSRLKWDPTKYGIQKLFGIDFDFWTPTLVIGNGAENSHQGFSPSYIKKCFSNGTVEIFTIETIIDTWCTQNLNEQIKWPNDYLKCSIEFGIHDTDLILIHDGKSPINQNSRLTQLSEWYLKNVSVDTTTIKKKLFPKVNFNDLAFINSIDTNTNIDMIIQFGLKRNQQFYKRVFIPPLIAASIILLLSFCLDGLKRGGLNLSAILIVFISYLILVKHIPNTKIPKIVYLYKLLLFSSCLGYILHILILWLKKHPPIKKPGNIVMTIINFSPLRFTLGIQYTDSADYLEIQEKPWREIGVILNRIIFIILIFTFLCVCIKGL